MASLKLAVLLAALFMFEFFVLNPFAGAEEFHGNKRNAERPKADMYSAGSRLNAFDGTTSGTASDTGIRVSAGTGGPSLNSAR